jgi:hypothetical protein
MMTSIAGECRYTKAEERRKRRERDSNPRVPKDISWRVTLCGNIYDLEADPF